MGRRGKRRRSFGNMQNRRWKKEKEKEKVRWERLSKKSGEEERESGFGENIHGRRIDR